MSLSLRLNRKRPLLESLTNHNTPKSIIKTKQDAFNQLIEKEKENLNLKEQENIDELGFVFESLDLIQNEQQQQTLLNNKCLNYWNVIMKDLTENSKRKVDEYLALIKIPSRYEQAINKNITNKNIGCSGDRRLAAIRDCLNLLVDERSPDQTVMHDAFILAVLPLIYGKEWESNCIRVMQEHNITRIRSEVICLTPRRFGKTYAVAMFATALLLHCPGIIICIFSTGNRASTFMREIILKMMMRIPGALNRIIKKTQEKLYLAPTDVHQERRHRNSRNKLLQRPGVAELHSFPSSVAGKLLLKNIVSLIYWCS